MPAAGPGQGDSDGLLRIAAALACRRVDFVAIGGWAVEAQGYDLGYKTTDIDFTPAVASDNLDRLSAALYDLDARIRFGAESFAFNHNGASLAGSQVWNLTCDHGDFDLSFQPGGTDGYPSLVPGARTVTIEADGDHYDVQCADIADIIRSKQAADRPKDHRAVLLLQAQLADETSGASRPDLGMPAAAGASVASGGRSPAARSAGKRERILDAARRNPKASAAQIARIAGASPGYAAAVLKQARR